LVGICIGYIPWLAWRCVPIAAGLSLYAGIQWWRYRRSQRVSAKAAARGNGTAPQQSAVALGGGGSNGGAPVIKPVPVVQAVREAPRLRNNGSVWWAVWLLVPVAISAALLADYNFFLFGHLTPPPKINEMGDLYPF